MSNPANNGNAIGRLAADPVVFPNKDGSKTVKVTIYADNNYTNKSTGKVESEKISLEKYIPAGYSLGAYEHMHSGDQVAFSYSLRNNEYTDSNGQRVYGGLVARIDSQKLLTGKEQSVQRQAQQGGQQNNQANQANQAGQSQYNNAGNTGASQQYNQQAQQNQPQQQPSQPPFGNQQPNYNQQQNQQGQQNTNYGFSGQQQSQSMANAPQYNQSYVPGSTPANSDNIPF